MCAHSWSSAVVNTLHGNQVSVGSKLRLVLQQKVGECTALEILLAAAQRRSPRLTLKLAGETEAILNQPSAHTQWTGATLVQQLPYDYLWYSSYMYMYSTRS